MPTVQVPGVGQVERKYVVAGLGVAGGIAVDLWVKRRNASAASTIDPNAIDPLTGLPYSAENQAATGFVNPNPVQSVVDTTGGAITTNVAWTQDVIDKLGNVGYDANYVASVIGKYLSRQPLTLDEAAVVRTAWAFSGKPPEGPDNFTLAGSGGSTPGNPGNVTPTPGPAPAPAPAPAWRPPATQHYGNSGDLVRQIQVSLKGWGFDPGPVDGKFGSRTLAAVKAFQRSRGLAVDGIVGPQTWTALHG